MAHGFKSSTAAGAAPGEPQVTPIAAGRASEIDGIRGWASLSVMLFHVFWEALGNVIPAIKSPVTAVLLNGDYAVMIFFILSGDALSSAFFSSGNTATIDRLAAKRYLRLTVPVFMSCAMVWLLMTTHADFHVEAAQALLRTERMGAFLDIDPSFKSLLRYAFYDVYAAHTMSHSFNPMLWTMGIELLGSVMVFIVCYLWSAIRSPVWLLLAVALFLLKFDSYFCLFCWGMLLSVARSRGWFERARRMPWLQVASVLLLAALWGWSATQWQTYIPRPIAMSVCGLIVPGVYMNAFMCRMFSTRPSRFLGRLSFPLYLTHFAVIISLMSWLVIHGSVFGSLGSPQRLLLIGGITVATSLLVATLFMWLETPVQAAIDRWLRSHVLTASARRHPAVP